METYLEKEASEWLEQKKKELLNNLDITIKKSTTDRETLEIMKSLIQTIKVQIKKH